MKSLILSRNGLVILAMLLIFILADWLGAFENASFSLYDKIRMLGESPVSNVLVVAIDEHTIANVGTYPIPSKTHLRLIGNLLSAGAELVGYAGLPSLDSLNVPAGDTLASP
ncbi:MAG: CHASE2 domain-containing protein, partial [Arenicellales bacterium]